MIDDIGIRVASVVAKKQSIPQIDPAFLALIIEIVKAIFNLIDECDVEQRMTVSEAHQRMANPNRFDRIWLAVRIWRTTLGQLGRKDRRDVHAGCLEVAKELTLEEVTAAIEECRGCCA